MGEPAISATMVVADVMSRWPATVWTLTGLRMACPGCPMAPFMTLEEVSRAYGKNVEELCRQLEDAIGRHVR